MHGAAAKKMKASRGKRPYKSKGAKHVNRGLFSLGSAAALDSGRFAGSKPLNKGNGTVRLGGNSGNGNS